MIRLRLLGHLSTCFKDEVELQVGEMTVAQLLKELSLKSKAERITRANTLILVNGVEVSALDGEETQLKDGDIVTLIPISHGG